MTYTIHSVYSSNMDTQNTLLGLLEASPNYGYQLYKLYNELFGLDKPILTGQIYSTLQRLERDGKIRAIKSDNKEQLKYEITALGTQSFFAWLEAPEAPNPTLKTGLYIKTVLALLHDREADNFLSQQRTAHLDRMRELTHSRQSAPLAEKLLIDHAIYHIEADLRWIDLAESRLNNLKKELKNE